MPKCILWPVYTTLYNSIVMMGAYDNLNLLFLICCWWLEIDINESFFCWQRRLWLQNGFKTGKWIHGPTIEQQRLIKRWIQSKDGCWWRRRRQQQGVAHNGLNVRLYEWEAKCKCPRELRGWRESGKSVTVKNGMTKAHKTIIMDYTDFSILSTKDWGNYIHIFKCVIHIDNRCCTAA